MLARLLLLVAAIDVLYRWKLRSPVRKRVGIEHGAQVIRFPRREPCQP